MNEEKTSGVGQIVLPVVETIDLNETDTEARWLKRQGDQPIVQILQCY